jgi:hypothetical protein
MNPYAFPSHSQNPKIFGRFTDFVDLANADAENLRDLVGCVGALSIRVYRNVHT